MTATTTTDISLPVLRKRTRARWRWPVLLFVQLLIIAHIVVWLLGKKYGWFGGKTITPIEPSEGMEFVKNGIINAGAIFFALALLSTLIFGRWFCGWGCHIVLLQDGCYWILRKLRIRPKPFRARILMLFPFGLAVYMFIWPLFYRFILAPWLQPELHWPGITTHLLTEDFWKTFASPIVAVPFLFICGFATVYVLGAKGFCTYGCPYGGFFKPLDVASPVRVRVNDDCQQCGKCTAVCTSNVRVHEEVNLYKMVIDSGCMKIMDCISVCPNDALSMGYGPTAIGKRTKKRTYDLSIWEELFVATIFLIGFFSFRVIYAYVPMLMAVGMSLVSTWCIWKAVTILRKPNVSFHKRQLKFHGSIKGSGVVFLFVAVLMLLFMLHCATIQSFKFFGDYSLAKKDTTSAMQYYKWASPFEDGGFALASNPNIDIEVANYEKEQLNYREADRLLRRIDGRVGSDEQSTMLIGQNLQNFEQYQPIEKFYVERLEANPDWTLVWEDYVGWLKRDGLYAQALAASNNSVTLNPTATRLRIQLALLEMEFGEPALAVSIMQNILEEIQDDPSMWMLYARALDRAGRREESQQAVEIANQLLLLRSQNNELHR